jgi:hypothetical protein
MNFLGYNERLIKTKSDLTDLMNKNKDLYLETIGSDMPHDAVNFIRIANAYQQALNIVNENFGE